MLLCGIAADSLCLRRFGKKKSRERERERESKDVGIEEDSEKRSLPSYKSNFTPQLIENRLEKNSEKL